MLIQSIKELSVLISNKKLSSSELVKECYDNINRYNSSTNAFITVVDEKIAQEKAKSADESKPISPLHGIPFVLKDAYVTKGIRTTSASNVLKNYIPEYSATVYRKLLDAGAILIGKMNMDAWGHGGSSENTDFGPVHNPWDLNLSAGGSSGGPAAAIASKMTVFGIGEDTGGSIRNPASWTNTSGLKVTYGRVSRYGSIAYASSFDTVGPMASTAEDCAYILEAIAGNDELDATSSPQPVESYSSNLSRQPSGITIGLPKEMYGEGLDQEIKDAISSSADLFGNNNYEVKEISMPIFEYGLPVYYLIGPSETSSNLGRYDGIRYGESRDNFTEETMRRIMIGTYALSAGYYDAYYRQAQKVRTLLIGAYKKAFTECDIILMPVTPTPPTRIGELISDPLKNLLADIYTTSQNPVGVPSLAIPAGFTKSNLPIGLQLVGDMFQEDLLLRVGHHYQQHTDWHKKKPPILVEVAND